MFAYKDPRPSSNSPLTVEQAQPISKNGTETANEDRKEVERGETR
jgi:hypothetical protein